MPSDSHALSLHDALPISQVVAVVLKTQLVEIAPGKVNAKINHGVFKREGIGPGVGVELVAVGLERQVVVAVFTQLLTHVQGNLAVRSEEHTSELQSRGHLVCRLL